MDHGKVLTRAWHMLWRYRALWVFGVILALTTTSWSAASLFKDNEPRNERPGRILLNYRHQRDYLSPRPGEIVLQYDPPDDVSFVVPFRNRAGNLEVRTFPVRPELVASLVFLVAAFLGFLALAIVAGRVARYVAETALIRMADEHEATGERRGLWQGLRLGWSRAAWRLFLIDLVVDVPAVLAFILLFLLVLSPLLLWVQGSVVAGVLGTLATGTSFFVVLCAAIVAGAVLTLLKRFFRRACVLEGLGVVDSLRQGLTVVRGHLRDVGVMWLVMLAIGLGWPILMVPVVLLLVGAALLLGGGAALLAGGLASLIAAGAAVPWIAGGVVGIPVFLLALVLPLLLLGGLREVFQSSTWTLTYRELRPLGGLERAPAPGPDRPGLEATAGAD